MSQGFLVHGPAAIYVGFGKFVDLTTTPPEFLGMSENGINITIQKLRSDVRTDQTGPMAPADRQDMGEVGTVNAVCTIVSPDTIERMLAWEKGIALNAGAPVSNVGAQPARGTLLYTANRHFRVIVRSLIRPYRFLVCEWMNAADFTASVKVATPRFSFKAWSPLEQISGTSEGNYRIVDLYDAVTETA